MTDLFSCLGTTCLKNIFKVKHLETVHFFDVLELVNFVFERVQCLALTTVNLTIMGHFYFPKKIPFFIGSITSVRYIHIIT